VILAEIGLDMSRFPTVAHLVPWAKLCPRTIQSGPATRAGKTGKGNPGDRLAGLTLMVTVLDQHKAGVAAAAIDEEVANIAVALSARKGYLDGRSLAEVFAWLRPTDLVWRYWVNNYVEGKSPAAFDVLFWNADTTRMAAALHRDMVLMGVHNSLATPGGVTMLGTLVDLQDLMVDAYVVAGVSDHISPWQACYRIDGRVGSGAPAGCVVAARRRRCEHPGGPAFWCRRPDRRVPGRERAGHP
jgi:poly(3-hydroxyalkanoate) synthetase